MANLNLNSKVLALHWHKVLQSTRKSEESSFHLVQEMEKSEMTLVQHTPLQQEALLWHRVGTTRGILQVFTEAFMLLETLKSKLGPS